MASGGHLLQQQKQLFSTYFEGMRNEELKSICRAYHQQVSGNKPVLLSRCQTVLDDIVKRGDITAFETLKKRAGASHLPSLAQNQSNSSANSYPSPAYQPQSTAPHRGGMPQGRAPGGGKTFKTSPFYDFQEALLPFHDLPEMPQNRNTSKTNLIIKPDLGQRLRSDGNLKILLYCREVHDAGAGPTVDIKFPNQIEVKVNNNDVKHNFKGLKNKPGSTKPADITSLLHKFGGQENAIQITYALTSRRFSYTVHLARYVSADELVKRIKTGNVISKEAVLRNMNKVSADADIEAVSARISLKDPVSTVRISLPVRSSNCSHNDCFDGAMFLQLQEQAPQWTCPVCNRHITFESLCVDKYFEDILNRTSKNIERVDVQPNGDWTIIKEEDDSQTNGASSKPRASYDDDFDDLVELVDEPTSKPVNGIKRESFALPGVSPINGQSFSINTPPLSSREPSVAQSASSAPRQQSNKRAQSAVIDLTLSDDEDDEPPRPAKRQSTIQNHQRPPTGTTPSYHSSNISLPTPRLHDQQPRQSYSSDIGQNGANSYRSSTTASSNSNQPRPTFPYNTLTTSSFLNNSISPTHSAASPFSQHSSTPVWTPALQSRPSPSTPSSSHQQQQQQQQQQQTSMFPPVNHLSSFAVRPSSTSTAQNRNNQSSSSSSGMDTASHRSLRLPPMQPYPPSNLYSSTTATNLGSGSEDAYLYSGWRDGNGGTTFGGETFEDADQWDFPGYVDSDGD